MRLILARDPSAESTDREDAATLFLSRLFFCPIGAGSPEGHKKADPEFKFDAEEMVRKTMKPANSGAKAAAVKSPIETTGEVFADGSMIDLIGGSHNGNPQLVLWDGTKETVGAVVQHEGSLYKSAPINDSLLRGVTLPTQSCPHGTTRELLGQICKLATNLAGLDHQSASLVGRIVLSSHLIDAFSIAPVMLLGGPDTARAARLMAVLHCLCRHAVSLTGVTPAGICSLPSGAEFTYLISQASVSEKLRKVLDDASNRDRKIPFRGRLLDFFGVQVVHSDSIPAGNSWPLRSVQVSMIPTGTELPCFDLQVQHEITTEFQPKLLSFRRANLEAARKFEFDVSRFPFELRELSRSIAATTPDDVELQAAVFELLQGEEAEIRDRRWVGVSGIASEAILVAYNESPGGSIYVSELARIAQVISGRRGQEVTMDPGSFGKTLRHLGFATQPRDAKGKKLKLTEAVCVRAQQLTLGLGLPELEGEAPAGKGELDPRSAFGYPRM